MGIYQGHLSSSGGGGGGKFTTQNFSGTSFTATADGLQRWRYAGGSAVNLASVVLTALVDAEEIEIEGTSDSNTLTIPGSGVTGIARQNGEIELTAGRVIKFGYDASLGGLYEKSRA